MVLPPSVDASSGLARTWGCGYALPAESYLKVSGRPGR